MVAAIRSDAGASRRLLVAALEHRFTLLLSVALMVEYEAVMTRAQHLTASKLTAQDVGILLDAVVSVGEPVRPSFLWRPSLRDADDDMVLEVAVNGQADAIVTFNRQTSGRRQSGSGLKSCCPARRSNDWEEYHEEE